MTKRRREDAPTAEETELRMERVRASLQWRRARSQALMISNQERIAALYGTLRWIEDEEARRALTDALLDVTSARAGCV
jgi:hypothetical protein